MHGGKVCRMHGGMSPQAKLKARERIAALRDLAGEKFKLQLERNEVAPPVTMATVRDYTKTLAEMDQHEAASESSNVIDDWLEAMRGGQ